ncbi:MAG: hypothetical protein K0S32_2780 [Bacteroidetes bacterium]|jgi:hypothetical protein|nr:hypothetical protein [Bacteroidota bacterium]
MLKKIKENHLLALSYLVLLITVLCSYSLFSITQFETLFNSDTFGTYCIYKDIFYDGGDIKGWQFAAAPCVFPDYLFYFTFLYLCGGKVILATFVYQVVQLFVAAFLMVYIFKRTAKPEWVKHSWLIPVFLSTFYFESFFFTHDFSFAFFFTNPCYHGGAFINTLIAIALCVSGIKDRVKYILLFLCVLVFTFSDVLFVVMFVAPFIVASVFTLEKGKLVKALINIVIIITGTVAALMFYNFIKENRYLTFIEPYRLEGFEYVVSSFNMLKTQLINYMTLPGLRAITIIFTLAAFLIIPIVAFFRRRTIPRPMLFMLWFFVVFTGAAFAAPVLRGSYGGYDTMRYCVHTFFLFGIILLYCVGWVSERLKQIKVLSVLPYGIIAVTLLVGLFSLEPRRLNDFFAYYPEEVRITDSVCQKHNLKRGLSRYWVGKKVSVLSKNNIQVLSAFPEGNIYEQGSNINWFYEGEFDFLINNPVINGSFDPEAIKKNFVIKDTIKTSKYEFLIVEKFYYRKGEFLPKLIEK